MVIIPDHDDSGCADVFVDGTVNKHPCRFILDTGAGRTHLVHNETTAALTSQRAQKSRGVFGNSDESVIELSQVAVGPMTRMNLKAIRFSEDHPAPRNLLGMDVLGAYPCHFSFTRSTLTIEHHARNSGSKALMSDAAGHPLVTVQFGHVDVNAVWDTGAGISVVDSAFISKNPQFFDNATPSWGTDASGSKVETPTFIMSGTKIAGMSFAAHRVAAVDLSDASGDANAPLHMILGYTTLRRADWYFNFPEHWWELTSLP